MSQGQRRRAIPERASSCAPPPTRIALLEAENGFVFVAPIESGNSHPSMVYKTKLQCHRNPQRYVFLPGEVTSSVFDSKTLSRGPGSNFSDYFGVTRVTPSHIRPATTRQVSQIVARTPSATSYTPIHPHEKTTKTGGFSQARRAADQHSTLYFLHVLVFLTYRRLIMYWPQK